MGSAGPPFEITCCEIFVRAFQLRGLTTSDLTQPLPLVASLNEFAINVGNQPRELTGRVLTPPVIEYRSDAKATPNKGAWMMSKRDHKFLFGAHLSSFGIIIIPGKNRSSPQHDAEQYLRFLIGLMLSASHLGKAFIPSFQSSMN